MNKTIKCQIIKPADCDWILFGKILREIQYETRQILNKSIQLSWEYQGFSSDYKDKFNIYPKAKDILNKSNIFGYCYNILKDKFDKLNTGNLSATIKKATDKFESDKKDIIKGNKSIANYKKDSPIDMASKSIHYYYDENKYYLNLSLISNKYKKELNLKSGQFMVLIKANDNSQKTILNRILTGEYKKSASQIIYKNNKWFINLSYSFESKTRQLDYNNIMGIDLGIVNAVYFAFNNSLNRGKIEGGEITNFRKRVESRRNSILKQGKYCGEGRIGHGKNTRIKPIETMSEKVANFRDTTNHKYSKYIIDQTIKNNCGIIQIEDLSGISKNNTFLKNWSYYDLQQKIEYKAKIEGIKVNYINPKYTSQRCSKCGYIHEDNRQSQASFKCIKCEFETNADFNAARNIATSNIEEIIENQCKVQGIVYKNKKECVVV